MYIRKLERLISVILEITDTLNIKSYLITIDIEDVNNPLSNFSLMAALKKCGLASSFLEWIEAVLKNQQSCLIHACATTPCFKLEKRAPKGDCLLIFILLL